MSLYSFLKKRFLKLYPVLFINTLLMFVYAKPSILKVVRNLLFLQAGYYAAYDSYGNITFMDDWGGATWFLAPLIVCYVGFYYITKYCQEETCMVLYVILTLTGTITLEAGWEYPFFNTMTARGLSAFFCGALFWKIWEKNRYFLKDIPTGIVSALILSRVIWEIYNNCSSNLTIISSMIIMPNILVICDKVAVVRIFMENPVFQWFGRQSLMIYLLHMPIRRWMEVGYLKFASGNLNSENFLFGYLLILFAVSVIYARWGNKCRDIIKKIFTN